MRQNPTPTPTRARVALLAGGLLLLVAGIGLVAWVLASSAGLTGRDDPVMADPTATTSAAPAGPYRYAIELAAGSFGDAGVGPGARVVPVDPAALPEPA